MKKILYTAVIGMVLGSCGGGGDDPPAPTPTPENKVPTAPTLVAPINNKLCIDNTVSFQWNASTDPEGGAITYQIQVTKDNQFNQIAHSLTGSSTSQSISLEKGIAYYWRVKALDNKNASSSYSTVFNFYTEGTGATNHIPFSPELVLPALNSVVQTATTTLSWNASDVDTGDALTFDVFFGTANPPTAKLGDNQTAKTLNVNLTASANYYWKVVVKDNKGGVTIGQIWNFKTD
ncbi:MAG TPA: hypothetical protein VIN72_12620 [Lutibacter sp.]